MERVFKVLFDSLPDVNLVFWLDSNGIMLFHYSIGPGSTGRKERRGQKAGTLGEDEQQMLAVARDIMAEPTVLIIEELSLGLAPMLVLQLFESLNQLRGEGITLLLAEQIVQLALAISDHGYVLAEGKIESQGPARQLIKEEHVRFAYLGL